MNKSFPWLLSVLIAFNGCSSLGSKDSNLFESKVTQFNYEDKNGSFKLTRQTGMEKNTDRMISKHQLELLAGGKESILEQSIVISNPGSIKGKNAVLRPEEAQYIVWFEGKKYTSTIKINTQAKSFELKTSGPTSLDKKNKQISFPKNQNILCFFSQLTECLNFHGFIKNALKQQSGSLRLNIIWSGYPFFQEAYNNLPMELFSEAKFAFDGKIAEDEFRFTLGVAGQMIFFVTSESGELKKMFWIAQGISMVRQDLKEK